MYSKHDFATNNDIFRHRSLLTQLKRRTSRPVSLGAFMKSSFILAATAAAGLLSFSTAQAQDNFAPDINNGDAYRNNAIIGLDPQTSYIRLANFRDEREPVRNYVEVYGLDRQKPLGRFEIDVRPKAAVQLSYRSIIGLAGIPYDVAAAQDLVLYVQNGREKQL